MKTTDKIKLNTTVTVLDKDGTAVEAPASRSIKEEILRLRHCGFHEAADRLESSCDDTHLDTGQYVEIDPTDTVDEKRQPKPFVRAWAEQDAMDTPSNMAAPAVNPAKRPKK